MTQQPDSIAPTRGQNWIQGEWVEGQGDPWQKISPAYEQVVWSGNFASTQQARDAIDSARANFLSWADRPLDDRIAICRRFAALVEESREELAQRISLEVGKPLWESRTEVAAVIGKIENSIDSLMKRRWTVMETTGDYTAVTRFRPHGVLFVLGPFNFPAHLPNGHIVPALLAGNALVFKPSEHAPATGQWLCRKWHEAGLPDGVLNLVHGDGDIGRAALDKDVDGILFTGSYRVGEILHRELGGHPEKLLALELGGNNPLVVHGQSDIDGAATTVVLSAYLTSGQRCTCARRLIISGEHAYERIVDRLREILPKIRVGLPFEEPQPFMGPLIHARAAEQILKTQQALIDAGGEVIVPVEPVCNVPALLRPGLMALGQGVEVEDSEHFGPLLTVKLAADLDEAIALASNTQFGLSAGFLGESIDDFHYFLHRVRAGVVNWNRQTTGASGKLPFGGVGLSGNHNPSGYFAADYCSYPVASLESHELKDATKPLPGLDFM